MRKFAALSAFCLLSAPVFAGGPTSVVPEPEPAPTPAPVADFDWTGLYVGAFVGDGEFGYGSPAPYKNVGVHAGYLRDFGTMVLGGELAYMRGEQDSPGSLGFGSTRLKLIGGLSLDRFMPYGFAGVSRFSADYGPVTFSDSFTIYGVGARVAVGASGRHAFGVEYLVETTDDFNNNKAPADNSEISLRYDFRF